MSYLGVIKLFFLEINVFLMIGEFDCLYVIEKGLVMKRSIRIFEKCSEILY